MLTDEERTRIRAEEIFRLEVCRELEANKHRLSRRERLWSLLNSSFALWFLSSIVLAGLTGAFTNYQNRHGEQIRKAEIERRLDTEISNRISQALAGLRVDRLRIEQGASYSPRSIYINVVSYLNNSFINNAFPQDFSVYTEYQRRNFRSLVFELSTLVDSSARPELVEALAGYEKFADLGSIGKDYNYGKRESLKAVMDSVELLNRQFVKPRWRSYLTDLNVLPKSKRDNRRLK